METYTLYDLNEYIRRVLALNFPEPLWITCEISSIKNSRGNYYFDLVQQNENNEVIAQSQAVLWYRNFLFLKSKLGELIDALLKDGIEVKIKVSIDYNERYGLKLVVEDVDPTYTLGQMEMARKKILERLKNENVLELNKSRFLPTVVQKIAVISAENAAGYIDFKEHLYNNAFGYGYSIKLFQAALQGQNTEKEVISSLKEIQQNITQYDVVVIIRGGGSKLDLAAFDNFNLGMEIAKFPIPVITGIGHEIDNTIADIVAFETLKTPTAVANFILDRNQHFEMNLIGIFDDILKHSTYKMHHEKEKLNYVATMILQKPITLIEKQKLNLTYQFASITQQIGYLLQQQKTTLASYDQIITLSKPENILKRGFVLLKSQDQYLVKIEDVKEGQEAEVQFQDGTHAVKFIS